MKTFMDKIKLLQKLIQIPSISGHEEKLAKFILNYCLNNHLSAKIQKGNVIVQIKGNNKTRAIIFNAHMDTVSVGNKAKWKYPPFGENAGKIVDGKIYGLGASDDKAAIASMMSLAKSVSNPPCDVWFTFVCNEETDGSGAAHFLQWFKESIFFLTYKHIAVVIGEPTNLTNIELGYRGNAFVKLKSFGITGHSAKTYSSDDLAIDIMLKTLNKLRKEFALWKKKYKHKVLGEPNLNITGLHTLGESMNKLPDECWATLDIRTTPMLHANLNSLLDESISEYVEIIRMKGNTSPGFTEGDSSIVKICRKILPEVDLAVSLGSTDFSQFILAGIDTVVLGPGDEKVIHKENEHVKIANVEKAVDIYKRIVFLYSE